MVAAYEQLSEIYRQMDQVRQAQPADAKAQLERLERMARPLEQELGA